MFVITGPGRSGTTFIAQVYGELGYTPLGDYRWDARIRAGYETVEIVAINQAIANELRVVTPGKWESHPLPEMLARAIPESTKSRLKALGRPLSIARRARWIKWNRVERIARMYGDDLRALATSNVVAKDPLFTWVLPVWVAAGCDIDHVAVCLRDSREMLESRSKAGLSNIENITVARNVAIYGVGICISTIIDANLPHSILRFPDFLSDPALLHRTLRFPRPVQVDELTTVVTRLVRPEYVHHRR